ncbi:murein hydrolase activator EnvC family protein [Longimicrobium sp.]|uniref:murein hydrolase activator EnvC family protein n=1 Tax=Longimicrobium sp. TaxID=2029185 RepID=UPI002E334DE2|nr:peptidoglycan DD-metalloendopeptidase family protein [Longimicrobium sp.]HEX6041777.1 peptidoglycan DD-metalloendopeptidase family protein [Longimicrobium sp.]
MNGVRRAALGVLLAGLAALPFAVGAQQDPAREISESQRRLQQIRQERQQLRGELSRIRSRVGDVSAEIRNIQRQQQVSASLLREINLQLDETARKIDETTAEMIATQGELQDKRDQLNRRLRDIYKRGPVHNAQVLLTADSFSDLLNRYKYLYLVARRDRSLVSEVSELARELEMREHELRRSLSDIQYLQSEREQENATLATLRASRGATLTELRTTERRANTRLESLARDERRMTGVIADLERRRRENERRAAAAAAAAPGNANRPPPRPAPSTMTTADLGALDWPVGGRVVYSFGRATQSNGTTIRYNGIGIGAAAGTAVRAVEAGTVEMAAPFEGYGPTVVVSHGGGYYSLYLYLREIHVRPGAQITKGQTIGTVGGEGTPEGAHVEFQIREPGGAAVDPITWLRRRG